MPINAALIVCGLTNNQGNAEATAVAAFTHEGMTTLADFAHMTDKDAGYCRMGASVYWHVVSRMDPLAAGLLQTQKVPTICKIVVK